MALVLLGSDSPKTPATGLQVTVNGDAVSSEDVDLPSRTTVLIETPDMDLQGQPIPLDKKLSEVRNAFALHSDGDAAWVEGIDVGFTDAVSQIFNCPIGRPQDWDASAKEEVKDEVEVDPNDGVIS